MQRIPIARYLFYQIKRNDLGIFKKALAEFGQLADTLKNQGLNLFIFNHIKTIETLGGGSVRCMLSEIFLPERLSKPFN